MFFCAVVGKFECQKKFDLKQEPITLIRNIDDSWQNSMSFLKEQKQTTIFQVDQLNCIVGLDVEPFKMQNTNQY